MLKKYGYIGAVCLLIILSGCSHGVEYQTSAKRLSSNELQANGHTQMNSDYSDNNITSYDNRDGTKTIYVYAAPVEKNFDDETGEIKIEETDSEYVCQGSYVQITIPKTLTEQGGITVKNSDGSIELFPLDDTYHAVTPEKRINMFGQERACYKVEDYFGKGADLYCTATSFGINLEYQIRKKFDSNVFKLRVKSTDVVPNINSPDYIQLMDINDNEKIHALLYTPICSDRKGVWNYDNGISLADKDAKSGAYILESKLNTDYLNKAEYPVSVSQSLYLYVSKEGDTPVYSGVDKSARHYLSQYMLFGTDSVKGEGYDYIRFPALEKADLTSDCILSAEYCFRNLFDLNNELVLQTFAVKADWCGVNTIWDSRPSADEIRVSETVVRERGDYSLDITELFREMMKNKDRPGALYSVNNGFYIKAADGTGGQAVAASADNGLFSPYLKIVVKDEWALFNKYSVFERRQEYNKLRLIFTG